MRRTPLLFIAALSLLCIFNGAVWAAPPRVIFDQGHGQPFRIEEKGPLQLSGLAALFRAEGFQVRPLGAPLDDQALAEADVLVSAAPFHPYSPAEIEAVLRFLDRGGRVALLLHVPPPAVGLLDQLGVAYSSAPVREGAGVIEGDPLHFRVTPLPSGPFKGVKSFALFGAWALRPLTSGVRTLASTGPNAWVDLDGNKSYSPHDARQSFAVAVTGTRGKGRYIVFGDDTAFQDRYLEKYNAPLGRAVVRWLKAK